MRKTRFDIIMEELEQKGKVYPVDQETRDSILNGLREVMDEHHHSDKLRQHSAIQEMRKLPPLI